MEREVLTFEKDQAAMPQTVEEPHGDLTAQGAAAQGKEGAAANLNGLQKFKDVDSLIKAYSSLEAEFTRRSQKLRELEAAQKDSGLQERLETSARKSQTVSTAAPEAKGSQEGFNLAKDFENNDQLSENGGGTNGGGEALSSRRLERETGDFLKKYPSAQKLSAEIANAAALCGDYSQGFLERAYLASLEVKLAKTQDILSDGQKLKEYVFSNPDFKEAVIREYLGGFKGGGVSLLTQSGAGIAMPPKKPATISEAGNLARELLQKK